MYFVLLACQQAEDIAALGSVPAVEMVDPLPEVQPIAIHMVDPRAAGLPVGISIQPHIGWISATRAQVWVRLSGEAAFRVHYGPTGSVSMLSEWVLVTADQDYAGIVTLDELVPSTEYEYIVEVESGEQSSPRFFHSLSPPGEGGARVALVADGRSQVPTPVFEIISRSRFDMLLQIGDFDHRDPYDRGGMDSQAWWDMYRDLLRNDPAGKDLDRYLLGSTPLVMMWDDHDYGSDNGDRKRPYRDLARSAFSAYVGRELNAEGDLWTRISNGPLDIFVLDLRSERDPFQKEDGPDKTMMGEQQWDWLTDGLRRSSAPFKLIVSSVPFNPTTEKVDAWFAYENERQRLLAWLSRNRVENVFVVSGDIHTGGAIDDGSNSGIPEMNLPTTNLRQDHCTAPTCGEWSEGLYDDYDRPGFGLVEVKRTTDNERWICILSIYDENGNFRFGTQLVGPP